MYKRFLVTTSILLTLLSACTTHPGTPQPIDTTFITQANGISVAFRSLRMESGTTIKGQLHRTGHEPVRTGHVDYAIIDANGSIREQGWVEHSSAIRMRHTNRPSRFSISLKQPLANGEKVRLSYHQGNHP